MKMQYLVDKNAVPGDVAHVFDLAISAAIAGLALPAYRRSMIRVTVEHVPLDYRVPSASFDEHDTQVATRGKAMR